MLILTIYSKIRYDDLIQNIYDVKEILDGKGIYIKVDYGTDNKLNYLKIFCEDNSINGNNMNTLKVYIGEQIYKVLVNRFCSEELESFIYDKYFFLRENEICDIIKKIYNILLDKEEIFDGDILYCVNRKNTIKKQIVEFLKQNSVINIEGFATFRIKQIIKNIYMIGDKVVENYMADKEYTEFIKLLQYFVEIQESKINVVNIIFKNDGKCLVIDDRDSDLIKEFTKTITENEGINIDDIIMSGLVTNCPKKIIIHKSENAINKEFINTLKSVFEDRVSFCDDCRLCRENKKNDKLLLTNINNSNKIE